jgi:hypothetical protein
MQSNKTLLICGITLFFSLNYHFAQGQSTNSEPATPQVERVLTAASINYLGLALTQERGIGPQTTVLFGIGGHYSFYNTNSPPPLGSRFITVTDKYFGREYSTSQFTPYLVGEVRKYTRLFERSVRGRNVKANSGNYFALVGEIPFATGNLINVPNLALAYPVGAKYGLRRPLGQSLYIEGSIGLFLKISSSQQSLAPRLDLAFAWHR